MRASRVYGRDYGASFLRDSGQIGEIHGQRKIMIICITHLIWHDVDHLHSAPAPLRRGPPLPLGLNLGMYTIQDGRGFGLPQAIRAIEQGNYYLVIFMETNITDAVYCRNRLGYDIVCSKATVTMFGGSRGGGGGGVRMVSRELSEGWIFDYARFRVPNVVSCNIISGNHIMPLIGVYLTPSTLDHLPYLEESLNCFLVRDPVVLGDLNTNIGQLRNPRDQQVSVFLASFGLVDLLGHFRQRLRLH